MAMTFKKVIRIGKKIVDILIIDHIKKAELMVNGLLDVILSEMEEKDKKKQNKGKGRNKWKKKRVN